MFHNAKQGVNIWTEKSLIAKDRKVVKTEKHSRENCSIKRERKTEYGED